MTTVSDELQQHALGTGHYGYSAVDPADLGATEYTLAVIVNDVSSSVEPYKKEMEVALGKIVESCKLSPRADNLMIRFIQFHSQVEETHGFKLLTACNLADYDDCLKVGGMTALCDATENGISSLDAYAKQLVENEFSVNGIIFVMTDGCENASTLPVSAVKKALDDVLKHEYLESLVSILIGVGINDPAVSAALADFKDQAGMTKYEEVQNTDPKTMAKLAEFVSQSLSSQSSALGSGGPSQPFNLTI